MTTDEILYRSATLASGVGRTLYGTVMPYGQTVEVRDRFSSYRERFEQGSFRRSIAERGQKLRLFVGHDTRKLPVGKAVELYEQADGLHAAFEIAQTRDGDDALELVRNGFAGAFSIGFKPLRHRTENGVIVRTEASLREVSLVGLGTYGDAGAVVAGVRAEGPVISRSIAEAQILLLDI